MPSLDALVRDAAQAAEGAGLSSDAASLPGQGGRVVIPIVAAPLSPAEAEAARVLQICNACRYCEGFCAVFPAMTRRLEFPTADLHYLANLCHNCGACLHACQYAPPHEFAVAVPQAMARVRLETYAAHAWPLACGALYRRNGLLVSLALAAGLALFLVLGLSTQGRLWHEPVAGAIAGDFYKVFPHNMLVALFLPVFAFVLLALAMGVRRFWRGQGMGHGEAGADAGGALGGALGGASCGASGDASGGPSGDGSGRPSGGASGGATGNASGGASGDASVRAGARAMLPAAAEATDAVLRLKYLDGGHGQGCNEADDAFTQARRRCHHLTFYGFLSCFAATCVATLYHYVFGWVAPYAYASLPKLLGVGGGLALAVGTLGLWRLNLRRHPQQGDAAQRPMDLGFIALLFLAASTGLLLTALRHTGALALLLSVHLGVVMALFITMPYGKFAHGLYRGAALLKWSIEKRRPATLGLGSD